MIRESVFALVIASSALAATTAFADDDVSSAPRNHRTFGFGIGGGGGIQAFLNFSRGRFSPSFAELLPSIELQIFPFRRRDWAIDLTFPLWNTIITGVRDDALFLQLDAFLDFNVGKGNVRFIVGPGVGIAGRNNAAGGSGSLRIPAELGVEILAANHHIGLRFLARPWTEFVVAENGTGVSTGVLGVFVFTSYTTRVSVADAEP
ncbi:hypothetical protein BH09MYX1_BH09MYX1_22330 [soil metagenome]